jgi:hypothetical protein
VIDAVWNTPFGIGNTRDTRAPALGIFDTDWAVNYSNSEMQDFIAEMESRYKKASVDGIIQSGDANKKIKDMKAYYKKNRKIHKRYIIAIEGDQLVSLSDVLKRDFPDVIKTDITPVVDGFNTGYPRIKYNFN